MSEAAQAATRVHEPADGYNRAADVYDSWHWQRFWHRNERPLIRSALSRLHGEVNSGPLRLLDLGCGTGAYCELLSEHGSVTGVDPARRMLVRAAHKLANNSSISFQSGTATQLPLPDRSVGLTLCARSLCHEPDLDAALSQVARVTRAGGAWILTDVHSEHPYPCTRIPSPRGDILIETYKRAPASIVARAEATNLWRLESLEIIDWARLQWQPTGPEFSRIDKTSRRPVFYVLSLTRRG